MANNLEIVKVLSRNDVGLTGSHQSGIVVPKPIAKSGYFPDLGSIRNPFEMIEFVDIGLGLRVKLRFVHYNSKFYGGNKDEFQLTGMTAYFRTVGAEPNGALHFKLEDEVRSLRYEMSAGASSLETQEVIRLSNEWKVINY